MRSVRALSALTVIAATLGCPPTTTGPAPIKEGPLPVGALPTEFRTGFETGHAQPFANRIDWRVGTAGPPGYDAPRCTVATERAHQGSRSLSYAGSDTSDSASNVYFVAYELKLKVTASTRLSYWLRPQNARGQYVSVDLRFADGSTLRDSAAVDARGCSMHPDDGHCGAATVGAWTEVRSELGRWFAGKVIDRIWVAYDRPAGTGDFAGEIDDLQIASTVQSTIQCNAPAITLRTVPASKRVVPIVLRARDATTELADARRVALDRAIAGIQDWYADALAYGDSSFRAEPARVLDSAYTAAQWEAFGARGFDPSGTAPATGDGGCSMYNAAQYELTRNHGALLVSAGLPQLGAPGVLYYVIGGGGSNGSCGAANYLGASEATVIDNLRARCPRGRYDSCASDCSAAGVIAHEMGHGFGLPHGVDRPACTGGPSLMDQWWDFDRMVWLCAEDRTDLRASGYFAVPTD